MIIRCLVLIRFRPISNRIFPRFFLRTHFQEILKIAWTVVKRDKLKLIFTHSYLQGMLHLLGEGKRSISQRFFWQIDLECGVKIWDRVVTIMTTWQSYNISCLKQVSEAYRFFVKRYRVWNLRWYTPPQAFKNILSCSVGGFKVYM